MEQQFTIDKNFPFVKVTTDKQNELFVFKCTRCHKQLELDFKYAKSHDMKETGQQFLFEHKNCTEQIILEKDLDITAMMKKNRRGDFQEARRKS